MFSRFYFKMLFIYILSIDLNADIDSYLKHLSTQFNKKCVNSAKPTNKI